MRTSPHPEFYGWQLAAVLWLVYFFVIGCSYYGAPVMFPYMIEEIGLTRGQLSLGLTASMTMTAIMSPVCAWSIRRFGARHTMAAGGMIGACGLVSMSFVDSLLLYLLAYGLIGSGACLTANIPIQTTLTYWFKRRRGTALGLVTAGASIGGLVAPLALTALLGRMNGEWRLGWLCLASVLFLSALAAVTFVRNKPSNLGQYSDGDKPTDTGESQDSDAATSPRAQRPEMQWTLKEALRTRELWLVLIMIIAAEFVWQLLVSQGPLHLSDRGFTAEEFGRIYGLTVGLGIIGRLGAGFLVDRIEPKWLYMITAVLSLAGSILLWLVEPGRPLTLAFIACNGVAFGAFIVLWPTFIANYWGTNAFATINGFIFPIMLISNASVAPLSGFIYDYSGSYLPAFWITWGLLVVAFFAALALKPPQKSATAG